LKYSKEQSSKNLNILILQIVYGFWKVTLNMETLVL